jgi:quinol monooxygenase YgiN
MNVLITVKVKGDVAKFRSALAERADEFVAVAEKGKAAGAIHHRFGIGDGYVLVVDEWGSGEQFEKFFGDPALQEFIGSIGGDTSAPPDITVTEAVASPDEF